MPEVSICDQFGNQSATFCHLFIPFPMSISPTKGAPTTMLRATAAQAPRASMDGHCVTYSQSLCRDEINCRSFANYRIGKTLNKQYPLRVTPRACSLMLLVHWVLPNQSGGEVPLPLCQRDRNVSLLQHFIASKTGQ